MNLTVDLEELGLDRGGHLLVQRALRQAGPDGRVAVVGRHPELLAQLRVFAREGGHSLEEAPRADDGPTAFVRAGAALDVRWRGASPAGAPSSTVSSHAEARWGVAARGAMVEAGSPRWDFALDRAEVVWTDDAGRLYAQATGQQWDPRTAVPWDAPLSHPDDVEQAVVQVMSYLVENENAALLVPARFLGQVHPHYREVLQLLALQLSEEARHLEVFSRRAVLRRCEPALSTAGGQRSLQTLFEAPDFLTSTVLLSVLGEGTFVDLLAFLEAYGPDPVTRTVAQLAARDERRHVAAGMAHVAHALAAVPADRARMALAIEQRHGALAHTSGLNAEVHDALVLLAAGSHAPSHLGAGHDAVVALGRRMHEGRVRRLLRLGFDGPDAERLASLHTRNFM